MDLKASQGLLEAGSGPIGQALEQRPFDQVVLLSNYKGDDGKLAKAYATWARKKTSAKLALREVELDDPTDFRPIYHHADTLLTELTAAYKKQKATYKLTLHVSPGTPMMGAAWVILGKTKFPAEIIQTSVQRGLQTAAIPLDIAAEFVDLLPELLKKPDASLEARAAGIVPESPQFGDIVYRGKAMGDVIRRARKVAARGISVLIEGESGTGKELLARAIHEEGLRKGKPFIAVNCGALPETLVESLLFGHKKGAFTGAAKDEPGYFRQASGGTLFLDEIGELPLEAQAKLLRTLQEKTVMPVGDPKPHPVDVRVVAATNRNLSRECQEGRFREDLFYRLAIAVLRLPPLRERKGDVGLLIDRLLDKANDAGALEEPGYERKVLSAGARNLLLNHPWPGNVRELENTLMRATVWTEGGSITERDMRAALMAAQNEGPSSASLPPLGAGFNLDDLLADISRGYFQKALDEAEGNKTLAAGLLGLNNRQTLNNRMKALGMNG